jgi:uncharacterized membrane protein YgaE (UPF0421/DUF939 family)
MGGTILEVLKYFFMVLAYFFDPRTKEREERKKVFSQFKEIETQYRQALADGKPQLAAQIAKQMQDMRDQYKFLNVATGK